MLGVVSWEYPCLVVFWGRSNMQVWLGFLDMWIGVHSGCCRQEDYYPSWGSWYCLGILSGCWTVCVFGGLGINCWWEECCNMILLWSPFKKKCTCIWSSSSHLKTTSNGSLANFEGVLVAIRPWQYCCSSSIHPIGVVDFDNVGFQWPIMIGKQICTWFEAARAFFHKCGEHTTTHRVLLPCACYCNAWSLRPIECLRFCILCSGCVLLVPKCEHKISFKIHASCSPRKQIQVLAVQRVMYICPY